MKNKVVKNIPVKLPIWNTVIMFMGLDLWNATDLIRGICYTICVVIWLISIFIIVNQENVDIFKNDDKKPKL